MPRIKYQHVNFHKATAGTIAQANQIIHEYADLGFSLTLRQLYYQFVARGWIENSIRSYKRLGEAVNNGRLAGLIDWYAIVDRTRGLSGNSHWEKPLDVLTDTAKQYAHDKWIGQPNRVEVWVEKDALSGVIQDACKPLDVNWFSCRGFNSQSEQWRAAQRFHGYNIEHRQEVIVLHLADHDPSGIDMTRDNAQRLMHTFGADISYRRIALTFDQVQEHKPPPNPAKPKDSRYASYVREFGEECWELDALNPKTLKELIETEVLAYRDEGLWSKAVERQEHERSKLTFISQNFDRIMQMREPWTQNWPSLPSENPED